MKLLQLVLMGMLVSTPAWAALDSGPDLLLASLILMILAIILFCGGWGPIAIWVGALPAMCMIYGFLVLFNFTGENPRQESIFTAQRNYNIGVREAARLEAIRTGDECRDRHGLSNCNKEYMKCYQDNLCTGPFKQVYAQRARELAANPNAFRPGSQMCKEEYMGDPVNRLHKCW
jgi:hypothetical protein